MRACVVTVGSKNSSLGALKIAASLRRQGHDVTEQNHIDPLLHDYDATFFSCVFSWHLPQLVEMANSVAGVKEIGGPAVTFSKKNSRYVKENTGIEPFVGISKIYEHEPNGGKMVYFSRGCPAYTPACGFCPVPKIEGNKFTFYPDAEPKPFLLDNNLSALPESYQRHIIKKYSARDGLRVIDANSGFEPHTFTQETFERWSEVNLLCWRFGFDDSTEANEAMTMLELLRSKGVAKSKIRVYTMIGNEPMAECVARCKRVIDAGGEPKPQRLRPLDWLGGALPTLHDWTEKNLIATQRYFTLPQIWRTVKMADFYYQSRYPFREMGLA